MQKLTAVIKVIKTRAKLFLANQITPHPATFLLWFVIKHSFIFQQNKQVQILFYWSALVGLFLTDYNIMYAFAPFLYTNNYFLLAMMFLFVLVSCNQMWKVRLLLLTICDQLSQWQPWFKIIIIGYLMLLCWQIYHYLPFKQQQNEQYFIGFFIITIYKIINILEFNVTNIQHLSPVGIVVGIICSFLGYGIIEYRLQEVLAKGKQSQICGRIAVYYLKMMQQISNQQQISKTKFKIHAQQCLNPRCFRKKGLDIKNDWYLFVRQCYERLINNKQHISNPTLIQNYILYLLLNGQIIKALYFINKIEPSSYFSMIVKLRCQGLAQKYTSRQESKNIYQKQYNYALIYDEHCLFVRRTVNDILQKKIAFWRQIQKQNPLLVNLQKYGKQITTKMYWLNNFYQQYIKIQQQRLFGINGTILYSTYLLATTNLVQYAESLLKKIAKHCDQIASHQIDVSQVYAIRVFIQNSLNCQLNELSINHLSMEPEKRKINKIKYRLIIDKVSHGFSKLIKKQNTQLIGCQLAELIPDQYKKIHENHLIQFLDFDNLIMEKASPTIIMHRQRKIPIKGKDKELYSGKICMKYHNDIQKGLTFISTIRFSKEESTTAIVSFNGDLTALQQEFNVDVLQHRSIKYFLQKLRDDWNQTKQINEESCTIRVKNNVYDIRIFSPFMELFAFKQKEIQQPPPFHIEIMNTFNQQQGKLQTPKLKLIQQLKKRNYLSFQQSDDKDINRATNLAAISQIFKFCQNSQVSAYKTIALTFTLITLICLSAFILHFIFFNLQWDNQSHFRNPIADIFRLMNISSLTVKAAYSLTDYNFTNPNEPIEQQNQKNYSKYLQTKFNSLELQLRDNLKYLQNDKSQMMTQMLQTLWNTQLKYNTTTNSNQNQMSISYIEVILNYIVDLNIINLHHNSNSSTIQQTFNQQIIDIQNIDTFKSVIDLSIDYSINFVVGVGISSSILSILLLIPVIVAFKDRLGIHAQIFEVIASVNSIYVSKQIKSLQCVISLITQYDRGGNSDKFRQTGQQLTHLLLDSQHSDLSSQVKSRSRNRGTSIIPMTNLTFRHKKTIIQQQQQGEVRIKAGQIDYRNSQCDPQNKFNFKHWVVYAALIVLLFLSVIDTNRQIEFMTTVQFKKNRMFTTFRKLIDNEITFLIAKQYVRNGCNIQYDLLLPRDYPTLFNRSIDSQAVLIQMMAEHIPSFQYQISDGAEEIISKCKKNYADLSWNSSSLTSFCQYDYSFLIIQGQFGALFKSFQQIRYNLQMSKKELLNINKSLYYSTIEQLRQKIFYIYTLQDNIIDRFEWLLNILFTQILEYSSNYQNKKLFYFKLAMGWGAFTLIGGFIFIRLMKQNYLSEVYMLSFLSQQMIADSKRVQSFIDKISKQTAQF